MSNQRIVLTAIALATCRIAFGQAAVGSDADVSRAPAVPAVEAAAERAPAESGESKPQILRGTDRVVATPKLPAAIEGAASSFKFEDAPLVDVVHVILRDIVKVDYLIHSPLAGNVTLATRGDIPPDQAIYLLESALQANGIVLARDARGVYHVGRPEALTGIVPAPRLVGNGTLSPGTGTVIIPLQYIGATEMAAILRPLLPANGLVRVDTVRNLLVLAGSRTQAEGWLEIVTTFDVDLLKGMSVGVFPLKHASVREVDAALRMLTSAGGAPAPSAGTPGSTRPATTPGGSQAGGASSAAGGALLADNPLFGAIRVMPIERINSLLVVTPRAAYLEEARIWIERLDRPGNNASEPQLYIYPVKNGSARHLAEVLSGIFGAEGRSASSSSTPGVAPGLTPTMGMTGNSGMAGGLQGGAGGLGTLTGAGGSSQSGAGQQTRVSAATTTAQGARVIADELNNAILIYSLPGEYSKIEAALKRLDLAPTQVLIEASIIEVTLGDGLDYGLQWYFTDKARSGLVGTGALANVAGAAIGAAPIGFSYTLRNSLGDVRAVLNALASKSLVKVISSPSLMVLDNHTAAIMVGNQQPIRSADTISTGGIVTSSIQYKDTGVNLQVTPSVSAENIVTMQINQAVTDVGEQDTATGQRAFLQRQIASKVAVRSGETLVLGGLIRDNDTTGKSGVPVLSDIPLIGALFGTNSRRIARTELLVVITPRVIRSDSEARDVSAELRDRMKGFSTSDIFRRP